MATHSVLKKRSITKEHKGHCFIIVNMVVKAQVLKGEIASRGMAMGIACIVKPTEFQIPRTQLVPEQTEEEIVRFNEAIAASRQQMETLLKQSQLTEELSAIFEAQLLLLEDPMLVGESREKIRLRQINAEWALEGEVQILRSFLLQSENTVFQERVADLEDVGNRILRNLLHLPEDHWKAQLITRSKRPLIIISDKLEPSCFLHIPLDRLEGLVLQSGSITSHLAILAQSHNIPALLQVEGALEVIEKNSLVFLDCQQEGILSLMPSEKEQKIYRSYLVEKAQSNAISICSPVSTKDGMAIELWVNLDKVQTSSDERIKDLSGVGLFRTEYLYLQQPRLFTSPGEHKSVFVNILKNLNPISVHFRLLDVGGDKPFPQFISTKKTKLGGMRFLLTNRYLLTAQLESILTAVSECQYPNGKCKILLPMVSSLEEVKTVIEILHEIRNRLETRMFQPLPQTPLGIMVETPAVIEMADILTEFVDFFCVGSNDLIRLNLAFDRNSEISLQNSVYHPAFYRQLKRLLTVATVPVIICGSIASEVHLLPLLLGIGVRRFSIPLSSVVSCAKAITKLQIAKCRPLGRKVLKVGSASALYEILDSTNVWQKDEPRKPKRSS